MEPMLLTYLGYTIFLSMVSRPLTQKQFKCLCDLQCKVSLVPNFKKKEIRLYRKRFYSYSSQEKLCPGLITMLDREV
jgi:hypothetical protein